MLRYCLVALVVLSGCGRYFGGPLVPIGEQAAQMTVNDDGSVTYALRRLEVSLRPMTDEQLNRQFTSISDQGAASTNPYTFGDWHELGDDWTPPRFTVFHLAVSNYEFPKVQLDPARVRLISANNRTYFGLTYAQLDEYFRAFWLARTGQGRVQFRERTDLLRRTMYPNAPIFSGQEESGYLVFPALHDDVRDIEVHLDNVAVRFDFTGRPAETLDLTYRFQRDIHRGNHPPPALAGN